GKCIAEAAFAMGGIGEARRAVDQADPAMAEIEEMLGGVTEGAFIVDVEPGVRCFATGAPVEDEGQAELGEQRHPLILDQRARQDERVATGRGWGGTSAGR